jgi:hypothetical protein
MFADAMAAGAESFYAMPVSSIPSVYVPGPKLAAYMQDMSEIPDANSEKPWRNAVCAATGQEGPREGCGGGDDAAPDGAVQRKEAAPDTPGEEQAADAAKSEDGVEAAEVKPEDGAEAKPEDEAAAAEVKPEDGAEAKSEDGAEAKSEDGAEAAAADATLSVNTATIPPVSPPTAPPTAPPSSTSSPRSPSITAAVVTLVSDIDDASLVIHSDTSVEALCQTQTRRDLQNACRHEGLNSQGKKTELAQRLIDARNSCIELTH